jgi:DNA-directed RNA polymerase subunit E'/Rpb7
MTTLYSTCQIIEVVSVEFSKNEINMTNYFKRYARDNIENRCRSEGYVKNNSCIIKKYSAPIIKENFCIYNVTYEFLVCNPDINNIYKCKIMKLTKIGIRGVISYHNNPIVFYISREHNTSINFDDYKEEDEISVRIIGKRFQLNDPYIEVIGEIVLETKESS